MLGSKRGDSSGFIYAVLTVLMVVVFLLDLRWGSVDIPMNEFFNIARGDSTVYAKIFYEVRLPKAFAAVLVGVSLSVSGLLMQTSFRNPLAGPYVLGISSGATLGAAIFLLLLSVLGTTLVGFWMQWGVVLFAMLGAFSLFLIILLVSFRIKESVTLLIVGMMLGTLASAVISVLQNISDPDSVKLFINWTLGSLSMIGRNQLLVMTPLVLAGLIVVWFVRKQLDLMLLGDDYASTMGVSVFRCRVLIMVATVVLTGVTTAFTGPVGFVGIAVPHIARMIMNTSKHSKVIPCTLLLGGNMMLLCDIICQLPSNGYVLPLNAVTAVLGIPVIIWVLVGKKRMFI